MISENEYLEEVTKLYKKTLEDRLISRFKKEFHEKIGYTPHVITLYDDRSYLPRIKLYELVNVINDIMEREFGNRKINRKLIRITSILRSRDATEYRFIYFKIGRLMGYNLKEIGSELQSKFYKGYDHTTVIHGIKTFDDLLSTSQSFALRYQHVIDNIRKIYEKENENDGSKGIGEQDTCEENILGHEAGSELQVNM
jgi:hypothetical protein